MKTRRTLNPIFCIGLFSASALFLSTTSVAQNTTASNGILPIEPLPTNVSAANESLPSLFPISKASSASGATSGDEPQTAGSLQERTTVQYRDAPLIDVIRHLCEESKINHVISPSAIEIANSKTVTLKLTDITLEVALKTVLDSYQLGTVLENGIVRIDTINNIKVEQENRKRIHDEVVRQEPTRVAIYQLNYTKSDQIAPLVLAAMKGHSSIDARFSVQPDTSANKLIVEGVKDAQSRVKALVESLDKRKQQVVIEARVIEASSSLRRGLGINWGTRFGLDAGRGLSSGLIFPNSIIGNIGGAGEVVPNFGVGMQAPQNNQIALSFGSINGMFNIDGILKAFEIDSQVNIIAQPTISTMDNVEGSFSETFTKKISVPPPAGSPAGTAPLISDFTMTLNVTVTPMIAADGSMELDINVTRDSPEPGATSSSTPGVISRKAKTRMAIRHGETAAIGGLYTTTKTKSTNRIPFLGSLPLIGFLFRDTSTVNDRTELMILFTPRILNNASTPTVATSADSFSNPSTLPPTTTALAPSSLSNTPVNTAGNISATENSSSENESTNTLEDLE
jgi:type IV pilus assembly protein PilQ